MTLQTLEERLRACVLEFGGSSSNYLPLVEFSCNNSYLSCIGMPLNDMLYGKKIEPIYVEENKVRTPDALK